MSVSNWDHERQERAILLTGNSVFTKEKQSGAQYCALRLVSDSFVGLYSSVFWLYCVFFYILFISRLQVSSLFLFSVSSFCALVFLSFSQFFCFMSFPSFLAFLLLTSPFICPVLISCCIPLPGFPCFASTILPYPFSVFGCSALLPSVVSSLWLCLFGLVGCFVVCPCSLCFLCLVCCVLSCIVSLCLTCFQFFFLQSPSSFCLAFFHCTPQRFFSFCFLFKFQLPAWSFSELPCLLCSQSSARRFLLLDE